MLQRYLLFWLVLSSVVAGTWPTEANLFDPFLASKAWLWALVATVMFCVGTLLPKEEVLNVLKRWPLVLGGTTIQYASMPFLAWLMATKVFGFTGDIMIGVILVGCVPGAMASNVLTMVARGNVSYSVGLTTSATLLSPLIVPIALKLTLGKAADAALLMDTAITLILQVVIPVIIGFLLSQKSRTVSNFAKKYSSNIANISILWIIAVVVASNRGPIQELPVLLMTALLLINLGGYLCGQIGGRALGIDAGMRRALMLEIGMQNAGVGVSLASALFPKSPEIALPCGLFAFGCMTTGTIFAEILKRFPPKEVSESSSVVEQKSSA